MSSKVHTVREAIITSLATITAGATYTYTLSATDQVKVGIVPSFLGPVPIVRVLPKVQLVNRFGDANHHSIRTTATFEFVAVAAQTVATSDGGLDVAEALLEDIEVRAGVDYSLSGAVINWHVANATLWGGIVEGVGDGGVVEGEFVAEWTTRRLS